MAATYQVLIAAVERELQSHWTLKQMANGRDTFDCEILSADGSYRPALDDVVIFFEGVGVTSSSVANPSIITTPEAHGVVTGQQVKISNHVGSTPDINGTHQATRLTATTFSIPTNVTVGGTGGTVQRRLFGGTIATTREDGLGGEAVQAIMTTVNAHGYDGLADRRYINETLLSGTLKSMLTTIVTTIGDGLTLHPSQATGPTLEHQPFEYVLLRDVLEQLSTLTEYVWDIDTENRLRMFLPASEACPFNVIDGDGNALGDITVEPTRDNYANKIIVRWSAQARGAYGFLNTTANFANGETVVLGPITYTFQTVLVNNPSNVLIGASAAASLDNLVAAITYGAGAGTVYGTGTAQNPAATAYRGTWYSGVSMKAVARTHGAAGNSITASETCANAAWLGEGSAVIAALSYGADQALTNRTVVSDAAEIAAHGTWETVIESPETLIAADATTLANKHLAARIVKPKKVIYRTQALGVRPGQTQTLTIADRNVNATFTIIEVNSQLAGDVIERYVTAIQSVIVQSVKPWQRWFDGGGAPVRTMSANPPPYALDPWGQTAKTTGTDDFVLVTDLVIGDSALGINNVARSGATSYAAGTGWILDYNAGTPRFRVGNPAGDQLSWDGSSLVVQSGEITLTSIAGGYRFTGSNALSQMVIHRNTSANASASAEFRVENNDAQWGRMVIYSSAAATSAYAAANRVAIAASGVGGLAFAATNGSGYIRFYLGATERVTIDNSGQVGVGTALPGALFHVSGGNMLLDNSQFLYAKNAAGTAVQIFGIDSNSDITVGRGNLNTVDNNDGRLIMVAGTGKEYRWLNAAGTILAFLQESTGFLSIGLATGAGKSKLHIEGASGWFIQDEQDTDPALTDLDANDSVAWYNKNNKLVIAYNNAGVLTFVKLPLDGSTTVLTHDTVAP